MHRLSDSEVRELRGIASNLPPDTYIAHGDEVMTGDEMALSGYDEMPEFKGKFEKDKKYSVPVPVIVQVNHYRRLKRAYLRDGIKGVQNYITPYLRKRKQELNERAKENRPVEG